MRQLATVWVVGLNSSSIILHIPPTQFKVVVTGPPHSYFLLPLMDVIMSCSCFFYIYKTLAYQLDLFNHKEKGDMSDSWLHAWCSRGICLGEESWMVLLMMRNQVPVEVHCGGIDLVRICTNLCLGSSSPGFSRFDAIQCSSLHTIFNLTNL